MKYATIVLLASLFPLPAIAADKDGRYGIIFYKGKISSCGTYVAARDQGRRGNFRDQNIHHAWLTGYFTAYNKLKPDTYDILAVTDAEAVRLWLENYCKQNPLDDFTDAVDSLIIELYPKRTRQEPK